MLGGRHTRSPPASAGGLYSDGRGPQRYLEILAAQVESQRQLVAAWAKLLDAGQVAAIRAAVPDVTKHLLEAILPRSGTGTVPARAYRLCLRRG